MACKSGSKKSGEKVKNQSQALTIAFSEKKLAQSKNKK